MTRTSRNRVAFAMLYNRNTAQTVRMTAEGYEANEIATRLNIPVTSVAAIKANLTRQTYSPFAYMDGGYIRGTCRY